MPRFALICFGLTWVVLAGCGHTPNRAAARLSPAPLHHFYDFQLIRSVDQQPVSLAQLVQELASSDVIFIGEIHSHSASHYLQIQLLTSLYQINPQLILSMEQFERDKQAVLDAYLDHQIGEQTLMTEGLAWPNYASDYRPLVEFAKAHDIPVIAANAPITLVRCIAQKGPEVADKLPEQQRAYLAGDLTQFSDAYQTKFRQFMTDSGAWHGHRKTKPEHRAPHGHGEPSGKPSNSFYAQLARDNTMAESIARALAAHPEHQVIAINGAFHSDGQLGTVDALKRLKPTTTIKVLSPYEQTETAPDLGVVTQQGDYIYILQAMPKRYVQKEKRNRAVTAMMKQREPTPCAW
jgi:uncharacterized iron-regulated protein